MNETNENTNEQKVNLIRRVYFFLTPIFLVWLFIASIILNGGLFKKNDSSQVLGESSNPPRAYILPDSAKVAPGTKFTLWIERAKSLGFVQLEISFDRSLLKLSQDVSITGPLSRVIKKTSVSEANSTGVVKIAVALEPSKLGNPPSATFQIAQLTFDPIPQESIKYTQIKYNNSKTQMYGLFTGGGVGFTTTGTKLTISKIEGGTQPVTTEPAQPTPPSSSPAPAVTSCYQYCKSMNYPGGHCWGGTNVCEWNHVVHVAAADKFCTTTVDPICCCDK